MSLNHGRKFGPLLTLQDLHLLLKRSPNIHRFLGVSTTTDTLHCFLKSQGKFRLFSLEKKVRHTSTEDVYGLSRSNRPPQNRTPLSSFAFRSIRIPAEFVSAPNRESRVGVRDNDSDVVSSIGPLQMFAPLTVRVDVDHSFAVDRHRESHVVGFRYTVHPEECITKEIGNA
jgi:hypothetical protein